MVCDTRPSESGGGGAGRQLRYRSCIVSRGTFGEKLQEREKRDLALSAKTYVNCLVKSDYVFARGNKGEIWR